MKVLALIHGYPNWKNSGAEWMVHEMFKFLVERGHSVTVRIPVTEMQPYVLDGVKVEYDEYTSTVANVKDCDLIITHLNRQGFAINIAEYYHKPIIIVHHNPHGFGPIPVKHQPEAHARWIYNIYNAEHIKNTLKYPNPFIVLHPPVDPKRVKTKRGDKITLINCWTDKGGLVLQALAGLLPDHEFLGVRGGYAEKDQVIASNKNITYIENTPDIKSVYKQTRILIVPSIRESYGRVAVEAMISGIPVIAHPTPGLLECIKDGGKFVNRNDIKGWAEAIKALDDPKNYKEASDAALARAKEIEAERIPSLEAMEDFMLKAINKQL